MISDLLRLIRESYGEPNYSEGKDLQVWSFKHNGEQCFVSCMYGCQLQFSSPSGGFSIDDYSEPHPEADNLKRELTDQLEEFYYELQQTEDDAYQQWRAA